SRDCNRQTRFGKGGTAVPDWGREGGRNCRWFAGRITNRGEAGAVAQRAESEASQRQFDRRSWGILGLSILVILAFTATIPSLYMALVRSGFLGDRLPPGGGWVLLVGLIGLTALFCLYMVHQQHSIN